MGAARDLRGAGRAAGAEVGGDGFGFRSLETRARRRSHFRIASAKFKYRDRRRLTSRPARLEMRSAALRRRNKAPCRPPAQRAVASAWQRSRSLFPRDQSLASDASVTITFGSTALSRPAICSTFGRGLIAKAMPAASPPQITRCVSGKLGRMKATASPRSTPRRRKRLPARVMRWKSSRCDQTVASPNRARLKEERQRGRVRRDRRAGAQHFIGVAGMFRSESGTRSMARMSCKSRPSSLSPSRGHMLRFPTCAAPA